VNQTFLDIVMGFTIIFVLGCGLISIYSAIYLKVLAKKTLGGKKKFILAILTQTLAWMVAVMISIMFFTNYGLLIFAGVLTLLIFETIFLLSGKILELVGKHRLFYSLIFSVIINPIWYFMLG
jgi:inner membrane protein involved in colicin E2 resistance